MRSVLLSVVGLVLGAAAGGTIANVTIPSHEQMRQFAADLVPPGTQPTGVGQVSGIEMFVGPYEAIGGFETDGVDVATLATLVRTRATEQGWTHVRTEPTSAGERQFWAREQIRATISIRNSEGYQDGTIFVRYASSPTDRFITGLALGGAAGLTPALLIVRRRSRPSTTQSVSEGGNT
jgi:hypothetical protein